MWHRVVNGDRDVHCDKCQFWYHTKCQTIPKQAHDALVRYKCLSWLCDKCKELLNGEHALNLRKNDQADLVRLESKVQEVGDIVRNHMKIIAVSQGTGKGSFR